MSPEVPIGAELGGRFRVIERLAEGPYGPCWRADDAEGQSVCVTLVQTPRTTAAADRVAVLERATRFGHPNAVAVKAHGLHQGIPFVASALAEGKAMRAWRDEVSVGGLLPLRDVRAAMDQVAQCLAAAHRGVDGTPLVHGGRLAASVWVERRGEIQFVARLGDWGVAWASAPVEARPGAAAAPDVTDDVHGLGVLLVELLAEERFGTAQEAASACDRIARLRPEVHPSVWAVARKCLSASPAERPDKVARVRDLLRQAVWTLQEVRVAPEPEPAPPPPPPPPPAAPERARVVAVRAAVAPSPPADRASLPPAAPALERVSLPVPSPSLAPPVPSPSLAPPVPSPSLAPLVPSPSLAPPVPSPSLAPPVPSPSRPSFASPVSGLAGAIAALPDEPVAEAPTARTQGLDAAPTTEPSLTSPVSAMKLGASRLGLATVAASGTDALASADPVEHTVVAKELPSGKPAVQPIDAQMTLRTPRGPVLEAARESEPAPSVAPAARPEVTSFLDLSALPSDPVSASPAMTLKGRRGTFLPVTPAATATAAASPGGAPVGRPRAFTLGLDDPGTSSPPASSLEFATQRPSSREPPASVKVHAPTLPPAPPRGPWSAPPIDVPTDPSIALPPPDVAHAPLRIEPPPAPRPRLPWWIPALAVAAVITLLVIAASVLS